MKNSISYNLKTPNSNVFFLNDKFIYQFIKNETQDQLGRNPIQFENIEVKFINSSEKMFFSEENQVESKTNYLVGNNKDKWVTDIPNFQTLIYNNIYKEINLKYYSENNKLKYDFVVNPGGNIDEIELEFNGQKNIKLKDGKLEITTDYRVLVENIPLAYQIIDGKKVVVKVNYSLKNNHVGFSCVYYDKTSPLLLIQFYFIQPMWAEVAMICMLWEILKKINSEIFIQLGILVVLIFL